MDLGIDIQLVNTAYFLCIVQKKDISIFYRFYVLSQVIAITARLMIIAYRNSTQILLVV